jgi:Mu-like prophage I protein
MAAKKIEQDFVLTDSSVNVYGFRLETGGYLIGEFLKNPIGYYGHEKEDGVLVRWEDVRVEGDRVLGKPVINLEHPRGARTVEEIGEGFLNAASLGNIVVLEHHVETDPTDGTEILVVDKWYNKECSLVDNPANREAFRTELADADGACLTVADLMDRSAGIKQVEMQVVETVLPAMANAGRIELKVSAELLELLGLEDLNGGDVLLARLRDLKEERLTLENEKKELVRGMRKRQVEEILEKGLEDGRFTEATRTALQSHFSEDPEGLQNLVDTMPVYTPITERLQRLPDEIAALANLGYDELDKANKLELVLEKAPGLYKEKYLRKFGKAPANV